MKEIKTMNTREEIISLLSKSKKPLGPKIIALELKKNSVNIRKILSNLYKEGKIARVGYGEYISSVNVKSKSVNVKSKSVNVLGESVNVEDPEAKKLINKEIRKYRKAYLQKLKASDPEAYEKMKKARCEYYKRWRAKNKDYNKKWLKEYHKKHPEKFREYQKRYWYRRVMLSDQKEDKK
ncbi:unnamed protein product [marine sediment metagenome]|uniref:Ribonuclease R winged-helix domain-containing protein n=1 Tax=marine sediment metagenome TaxID=412755 RepID=X1QA67_9ZZZZ